MQRLPSYRGVVAAFVTAGVLAACGGGGGSSPLPQTKATPTPAATATPTPAALPSPAAQSNSATLSASAGAATTATLPATGGITASVTVPQAASGSGSIAVTVATGADATMNRTHQVQARHSFSRVPQTMPGGAYLFQMDFVPSATMTFTAAPSFSLDVTQWVTSTGLSVSQAAASLQGLAVYAGIVDNTGGFNVVGPLTITATSSAITVSYAGPQMALTLQANQHYTIGIHLGPIAAATSTPAPTSTPTPTPAPTATPTPTPAPTPTPTATPFAAPSVAALYNLSNANVFVNGHTGSVASDGTNIWLTTSDNSFSYVTKMTVDGTATNYTVNTGSQNADKGNTIAIAHGPDGNMWFTDVNDSQSWSIVGKVTPEGTVTRYTVDSFGTTIDGIAAGPDGNLWFTEATKIGKITTSGTATFYTMPDTLDTPHRIIAGPDGNLWFTETGKGDRIGKITTSGTITEYTIHDATSDTSGDGTDGIAVGSDGNLWVVEAGLCKVAKVNPSTGNATEYAVGCGPNATPLQDIASGPNGIMWVTGPGWGVQFTPGNLFAVSTADGSVISGGALPGYLQPAVFASDSEGRLFFDPSGDYWIAGSTALMQIAP